MEKYYCFAGVELAVNVCDNRMYEEDRALAPFRVSHAAEPHCFSFEEVRELSPPEGRHVASVKDMEVYWTDGERIVYVFTEKGDWKTASMRVRHKEKQHAVQFRKRAERVQAKMVLNALAAEHLIAQKHGFVFHCSYIAYNGKAILFTAPSGTGKTTQAELWKEYRGARIINGDRAAVRLADGKLLAEGIPFAGSSQYCKNRSLPIEAIVYLGQAPETTIRKLRGYEAFSKIWEGVSVDTWDREDMENVSQLVQKAAQTIPVYHLPCTPDESAVIVLEDALRKQVTP